MKKEELIKGKWYKVLSYSRVYYKFNNLPKHKNHIEMIEYYDYGKPFPNQRASNNQFWETARLATLDELKSFLPKDHPDLLLTRTYELW